MAFQMIGIEDSRSWYFMHCSLNKQEIRSQYIFSSCFIPRKACHHYCAGNCHLNGKKGRKRENCTAGLGSIKSPLISGRSWCGINCTLTTGIPSILHSLLLPSTMRLNDKYPRLMFVQLLLDNTRQLGGTIRRSSKPFMRTPISP